MENMVCTIRVNVFKNGAYLNEKDLISPEGKQLPPNLLQWNEVKLYSRDHIPPPLIYIL